MSSTVADVNTQDLFVSNSAYAIALCILYYDYALTFEDERRLFWKSPWTRSSLLFFINRYPMLLGNLALLVVRYLHGPTASCQGWQLIHQLMIIGAQIIVMAILLLRTYALHNRDKRVLCLLVLACIAGTTISTLEFISSHKFSTPSHNLSICLTPMSDEQAKHTVMLWFVQFGIDLLVVTLTVARTWRFSRDGEGLPQIVRRDGAAYFGIMAGINFANILTFHMLSPNTRGCLGTLASCVSVTMLSRLQLNLQAPPPATYFTSAMDEDSGFMDSMFLATMDWTPDPERDVKRRDG